MSFFQVGWSPVMTNNSKILALKYRPQTFKDLIGQEEIATTIYNSIKNNNSTNAFLFTGIRGIGKTTFARIVAKALIVKIQLPICVRIKNVVIVYTSQTQIT